MARHHAGYVQGHALNMALDGNANIPTVCSNSSEISRGIMLPNDAGLTHSTITMQHSRILPFQLLQRRMQVVPARTYHSGDKRRACRVTGST